MHRLKLTHRSSDLRRGAVEQQRSTHMREAYTLRMRVPSGLELLLTFMSGYENPHVLPVTCRSRTHSYLKSTFVLLRPHMALLQYFRPVPREELPNPPSCYALVNSRSATTDMGPYRTVCIALYK